MGNKKVTLNDNMSLAQRRFIRIFARTGDYQHAAAKCFPDKEDPIAYAGKILTDSNYKKALIEYHCDKFGVTDEYLIKTLSEGIEQMDWNDPKSSKTKLDVIKEILKLKGRYPDSEPRTSLTFNNNDNSQTIHMDSAKQQVLSDIWDRTKKNLNDAEIAAITIDADFEEKEKPPVNSKETLFLKDPEKPDVQQ